MASLRRLWRFYGVPEEYYRVPAEFYKVWLLEVPGSSQFFLVWEYDIHPLLTWMKTGHPILYLIRIGTYNMFEDIYG